MTGWTGGGHWRGSARAKAYITGTFAVVLAGLGTAWSSGVTVRAAASGNSYTAVSPCRILDTRSATGPTSGSPMTGGTTQDVTVTGTSGCTVPSGATAVVMNATVTQPTNNGFLAIYPKGASNNTSILNFATGQTVANLTTIQVGSGGAVTLSDGQPSGTVHVILDLEGYYAPPGTSTAGQYVALPPVRVSDTRTSSGCPNAGETIGAGHSLTVQIDGAMTCSGGASGVPSTGVSAVVFNLTATNPTAGTFLTAYPAGASSVPTASNLNLGQGQTRPNRVIIPVGSNGQISIYNANGTVDTIVDVDGYYTDSSESAGVGSLFTPIAPTRFADTRSGTPIAQGGTLPVTIAGQHGVPANANAAVENVTDDHATQGSFFTVYPGGTRPLASDLNFGPGEINPNLVQATLSNSGSETIFNDLGTADAIVDVFGYFTPQSTPPPPTNQTYTVSAPSPSATPSVSTTGMATQGEVTYTVTGFNTSNTPSGHVDIALFPDSGPNAPANSSGTYTFTSSGGSGVAGSANGEATSDNQTSTSPSSPNQGGTGGKVTGCVTSQSGCFAYISSVNGSAQSNEPDLVTDVIAASGGTLTFTVNSFQVDGTEPVVFSEPSTADNGTLQLAANGQPAMGYPFGVGGAVDWQAAGAPAGTYTNWIVQSVNNAANTFTACDENKSSCLTFNDAAATDSYMYIDPSAAQSQAEFQAELSGPVTQSNGLPAIVGDEVNITYATPPAGSTFGFSNSTSPSSPGMGTSFPGGQADVPAAPTGLMATTTNSGTQLTWMGPTNPDVASDSSATSKVYRAPVNMGTVGTYAQVATSPCTPASSTCAVDTSGTIVAGQPYSYVVSAVSGTGNGNVAAEGPGSAPAPYTLSATAPISVTTSETPCTACTTLVATDSLKVVFNQSVTLATTWNLVVTDGTNVNTLSSANNDSYAPSTTNVANDTVTYVIGANGPVKTHGTNASLMNLEALTQMGVSTAGGQWNLPGSAEATTDGGSTSQSNETRVWTVGMNGSNSSNTFTIGQAPTASATVPNMVNVSACSGTDQINVYQTDGTNIGPTTPVDCSSGMATIMTSQTLTGGESILVTQEPANGYESLASPVTVALGTIAVTNPAMGPTAGTAATFTLKQTALSGSYTLCVGGPGFPTCSTAGSPAAPSPNGTAPPSPPSNVTFASGGTATVSLTLVDGGTGTLYFTVSGNGLTAPYQGSTSVTVGPDAVDTAYIPAGTAMCLTSTFTASALMQATTPSGQAMQTETGGGPPPSSCFLNPPSGISIQALDQYGNAANGSGMVNVVSSDSSATNVGVCSAASASCTTSTVTISISGGTGTLYLWINSASAFSGVTLTFSQATPPTPNNMYKQVTTVSD